MLPRSTYSEGGVSIPAWTENAYHQHRFTNHCGVQAFLSRRKPAPLFRETRVLTHEPKFYYRDKGKDKGPADTYDTDESKAVI